MSVVQWLRRRFVTGFVVTVPLVISLVSLVWVFRAVDGLVGPIYQRWIPFEIPGLGIVTTAVLILAVGIVATNVFGRRLLQGAERYLMLVPVFRAIYAPVKQIVAAFSPDNTSGFKKVAIVEDGRRGNAVGFLTKEFSADLGNGPEPMVAVYVPTNHLYLGDVVIVPRSAARFPDLTVEEGVRIVLTGGMALPAALSAPRPGGEDGRPRS